MALLVLLAVLVALPATSLASATSPTQRNEQAARRATLKIVGIDPVAVAGRGFESGEWVRVSADGRRKRVAAGARGGFRIVLPQASPCDGLVVVARGSRGSRAAVTFANFSGIHCMAP